MRNFQNGPFEKIKFTELSLFQEKSELASAFIFLLKTQYVIFIYFQT